MIRVQHEDFDLAAELQRLRRSCGAGAGAVASFVGLMRDHNDGHTVDAMTLEHYPAMTEKALAAIEDRARERWDLNEVVIVHRIGELRPGDQIVLVLTAAAHRGDALQACQFLIDYLKTDAPFWKKERTVDGERWVDARASDDAARARWE